MRSRRAVTPDPLMAECRRSRRAARPGRPSQRSPSSAGRGCTTSRSASGCSRCLDERARIRSCGSPDRRGRASPRWSRATSRRASCPGCGSRPIPATPIRRRSSTTCASRRRTSPGAARARPSPRCRVFSAEYAGDLPAFTRRFMREFFALFPAGLDARRRQFPRSPRPTPRGASRSPKACARFPRASTSSFLSREPPRAGDGAARRRAAHHAHRLGGAALHAGRGAGAHRRRAARAATCSRRSIGERRLGRGHRADARAPRAREGAAPRRCCRKARRRCSSYFTGEIFSRARPENQRVLMLAALLPSVSRRRRRGDLRQRRKRRWCSTTSIAATSSPIAGASATSRCTQFHALFREFLLEEGRRRLPAEERQRGARPRRRPARRARRLRAAAALYIEAQAWPALVGPHAARRALAARRGPAQGARRLARRACPPKSASASRGWRCGEAYARDVRRARALQGAARARVRGLRRERATCAGSC